MLPKGVCMSCDEITEEIPLAQIVDFPKQDVCPECGEPKKWIEMISSKFFGCRVHG